MIYSIGDVVKSNCRVGSKCINDAIGIVIAIDNAALLVEFNQNIGGHNGGGRGEYGHCWWLFEDDIEPYYTKIEVSPVNDYSRACWHCMPGGIVDRLAFASGAVLVCPVCGRVCDERRVTK